MTGIAQGYIRSSGAFPRADMLQYAWISARARNAVRRRALIALASGAVFVVALMLLVLIPRGATVAARGIVAEVEPRPDSSGQLATLVRALAVAQRTDSALASARQRVMIARVVPADTLSPELRVVRDSLAAEISALSRAMSQAEQAPLPPAFRALGGTAALAGDTRVALWLDSLAEVDRLRAPFGALGAGDPIYVSLTARVNELGRSIRDAAEQRRSELRSQLAPLRAPVAPPPVRISVDTVSLAAERAAAQRDYAAASTELAAIRAKNAQINASLTRARELSNVGAPPLAMLGAALVIALAFGFAVSLAGEVRRPRIAHVREAESVAASRVLTVVRPTEIVERGRRQADADAPPLIDIVSESYRRLYLHLAATEASVPFVTVSGDEAAITATVAANLAAVAAYEARATLLVDVDPATNAIASVLRVRSDPGLSGVVAGSSDWASSIISTTIGRDRPLDVLPSGTKRMGALAPDVTRSVREGFDRMKRRYDLIVLAAPTSYAQLTTGVIAAPDVVLCARIGYTPLTELRTAIESLRGAGRIVHGVVLWDAEAPQLA